MSASPEAIAAVGKAPPEGYSNSALMVWVIVVAMRSGQFAPTPTPAESARAASS